MLKFVAALIDRKLQVAPVASTDTTPLLIVTNGSHTTLREQT